MNEPTARRPKSLPAPSVLVMERDVCRRVVIDTPTVGLEQLTELAGYDLFDVVSGPDFDVWVDDIGQLRDNPEPNFAANTLLSGHGVVGHRLVGRVVVAASDEMGETLPLPSETVERIESMMAYHLCEVEVPQGDE